MHTGLAFVLLGRVAGLLEAELLEARMSRETRRAAIVRALEAIPVQR